MSSAVLDSSALLALIQGEPGALIIAGAIGEGVTISTVNLCEIVSKLRDAGFNEDDIRTQLESLRFDTSDFAVADAWRAGLLRSSTRDYGLSLGDRACLALALALDLPVLTADRNWARLDIGLQITLIR